MVRNSHRPGLNSHRPGLVEQPPTRVGSIKGIWVAHSTVGQVKSPEFTTWPRLRSVGVLVLFDSPLPGVSVIDAQFYEVARTSPSVCPWSVHLGGTYASDKAS